MVGTLAQSFQMVAFQTSPEKQVCSANTPSSTIRRPSRQVNCVSPRLLSLFHLLSEAGVDVCFSSCKRGRFDGPDSFINLRFRFHFTFPICGSTLPHRKLKSKIQKKQFTTPRILFLHTLNKRESRDRTG